MTLQKIAKTMALGAAASSWSTTASASYLYLFQPSGGGAIGYFQSTVVPDTGSSPGGVAQFCSNTGGRCSVTFNDAYNGVSDQVDLYGPGITGGYDYYQGGAFTTPGFYDSQVGLFPTSLALIKLPDYQIGSFLYVVTFGSAALAYLRPIAIPDNSYTAGGDAFFCANTSRCSIAFNDAYNGVSDQVDLYGPGITGGYDYFAAGAFTNPGTYASQVGLFPATLTTIRLPDAFAQAVPEPATWALMIVGFGTVGVAMRRRPKVSTTVGFA